MENKINGENSKNMCYKNIVILIFFMGTLLFSLSTINAANNTITDSDVGGIAQGIIGTGNGDTLFLQPGTYNKTNLDTNIVVNKNITIQGNGSTNSVIIDAKGISRIFTIGSNTKVTFINITFINGYAQGFGGAIYNDYVANELSIMNCSFFNNEVYNLSSGGGIFNNGGAVFNTGSNCFILNCTFNNNIASAGSAVYNGGSNSNISNCNFTNNKATNYGAIYNANNIFIANCIFDYNDASTYGGAIFNIGGYMFIVNCDFTNNNALLGGGAITIYGGNASIVNCDFTNNNALLGGAIYNSVRNITVNNSNFIGNNATYGGGIYNSGNMSVSNNVMIGNIANLGQMIYNDNAMGTLNLTYIDNSTKIVKKGQTVVLYVILTDDMGNTITGQNITFYVNGTYVGNVSVIEGYGNLTFVVPNSAGILPITGDYLGHLNYPIVILEGELLVNKTPTNSTIIVDNIVKVDLSVSISGGAVDEDGNVLANVILNVIVGNQTFTVITNGAGEWNLTYVPAVSEIFEVSVSWEGNDDFLGFVNSTTFNVVDNKLLLNDTPLGNYTPMLAPVPKSLPTPVPEPIPTPIPEPPINGTDDGKKTDQFESNIKPNLSKANMRDTGIPISAILAFIITIALVVIRKK